MELNKVKSTTLQDAVHDELFHAIISGKIPPGTQITYNQIAKQMDVSIMPVRGAIARLEAKKIVTILKNKKIYVNDLSIEEAKQIYEVRLLLECYAAEKAAELRSDDASQRAGKILDMMDMAGDVVEYLELNREFHNQIYSEARLPPLMDLISLMCERISPYQHILWSWEDRVYHKENSKYHAEILKAFVNKDPKSTKKWVEKDLVEARKRLIKRMAKTA